MSETMTMTNLIAEEGESLLYVEPESHGVGEEGESLLYVEPESHGPWGYDELSDLGDELDLDLGGDWGDLDL